MWLNELKKELEQLRVDENYIINICESIRETDPKIAKESYEVAIQFARENDMMTCAYPWILYSMGWFFFDLTDFKTATDLYEEAYDIFEENNNVDGLLSTLGAFVSGYSVQQKLSLAIERGMEGIDLAEKVGNYERRARIKGNLAALYMEIDEYEKAKELLDQIENVSHVYSKANKVASYINLAECCTHMGDTDQAIDYITKALVLAKEYTPKSVPNVLKEMAHIYAIKGCYDMAEESFARSVEMSKEDGTHLYLQDALLYWAELDLVLGRYKNAIDKLQQVEKGIENAHSIRNLNKVYLNSSKAFKGLGNYEQAYAYLEKHMELEKQMKSLRSAQSMEMLNRKRQEEEGKVYKFLYNQTEALSGFGQKILSNLDLEEIFSIVAKEMQNLIQADIIQITMYNEEEGILKNELSIENEKRLIIDPVCVSEEGFWSYCIKNQQDIFMNDIEKEYIRYFKNFKKYLKMIKEKQECVIDTLPHSLIMVPIMIKGKITGVISTQAYRKNAFTLKDLITLKTLSNYLGIGLENARLYREVEYASKYDVLTKVFNRKELFKITNRVYDQLKESNHPNRTLCILMIDVDNFKRINDVYGHQEGDRVLEYVADLIQASVEEKDVVGRYGGEEFMIGIPGETMEQCIQKAEIVRSNVEKADIASDLGIPIHITVSIGIANLNAKKYTLEQIINYADKELFKAKNTGKNKIVILK